jgi:hypothetical protein
MDHQKEKPSQEQTTCSVAGNQVPTGIKKRKQPLPKIWKFSMQVQGPAWFQLSKLNKRK